MCQELDNQQIIAKVLGHNYSTVNCYSIIYEFCIAKKIND